MKKFLSFVLLILLIPCMFFIGGCGCSPKSSKTFIYQKTTDGKYIYFGEYPQSIKPKNVKIVDKIDGKENYFKGSDGAVYYKHTVNIDFEKTMYESEDNFLTAGLNKFNDGTSFYQDETLYFKVEKLKWRIIKTEGTKTLIVCDNIINTSVFLPDYFSKTEGVIDEKSVTMYYGRDEEGNGTKRLANDYYCSSLEKFMNQSFYNAAFSTQQKKLIQDSNMTTECDWRGYSFEMIDERNYVEGKYSKYSTKLFPLSKTEITNHFVGDKRLWGVTDFSIANGCFFVSEYVLESFPEEEREMYLPYKDSGMFWSRTAFNYTSTYNGGVGSCVGQSVMDTFERLQVDYISGVLPALYISL